MAARGRLRTIDWRPLTLNIPSFLGSAKVNETGKVVEANRTPRQWQGVRYAYMDAKRYARLKDILIYGPRKIWDSSLAGIGMLWTKRTGRDVLKGYMDIAYETGTRHRRGRRGGRRRARLSRLPNEGRLRRLQAQLHGAGIFGVPTYVIDGEVFFGREHLPAVRWLLGGRQGPVPDVAYDRFESAL